MHLSEALISEAEINAKSARVTGVTNPSDYTVTPFSS
jgi:hypothetical protein